MLSVCTYGGVVGYFSFLCEFCFLHCDDVRMGAVYEVFSSSILADFLWLIVICEWVVVCL